MKLLMFDSLLPTERQFHVVQTNLYLICVILNPDKWSTCPHFTMNIH